MTLNYRPTPEEFNRHCQVLEGDSQEGEPMIEVYVPPHFSLRLLIENSQKPEERIEKTYKADLDRAPRRFRIKLREVLGTHIMSPYGPLKEIDPATVTKIQDVVTPYGSGLDFERLFDALYRQIELRTKDILIIIDMPPHIHELRESSHFRKVEVDHGQKTLTIKRSELEAFPNPHWPARCLKDIRDYDGYTVLIVENNGSTVPYDSADVWPETFGPHASTSPRGL